MKQHEATTELAISVRGNRSVDYIRAGEVAFGIPEVYLDKMARPRLRGISLSIVTTDENAIWRMSVAPPPMPGQNRVPCMFGQVMAERPGRDRDSVSNSTFYNRSPEGEWILSFGEKSTSGGGPETIDDVLVFVTVAYDPL